MNRVSLSAKSQRPASRTTLAAAAAVALLGTASGLHAQTSTWTLAGNGNWNTAANWSPSGIPNSPAADAIINNNASNVVVTLGGGNVVVNSVRVDLGDTLQINSRLTVAGATLNGAVNFGSRAEFGLAGTIANSGAITLSPGNASGDTYIDVLPAGATLTGGGTLTVVNGSSISGFTPGGTLTLANQTIEGRGQFGRNAIGIVNQAAGLIRANVAGQSLVVDPGTIGLANQGTLSAVGGGFLQLAGGTYTNTGGTIRAENGSEVHFNGADLTGGTIVSVGTGLIRTLSDSFFTNTTLNGNMVLGSRADLGLTGTIINTGNILFTPGNATSDTLMDIQPAGATLTGGGSVTMVAGSSVLGTTPGGTLTLANQTIEGRGQLGRNSITIVNQIGNVIRSNVTGQTMTIDPGTGGLTNAGTIETANGGHLALTGNGGGTFNNAAGRIRAATGTEIQLNSGVHIVGGILESAGTGLFRTSGADNAILEGVTINGHVTTNSRGDITLRGTINNLGTIQINPGNATSDTLLEIEAAGATLVGGGAIFMNGNTSTQFTGAAGAPLTIANQTIRGGGWVGSGQLTIDNQANGILHADTAGGILLVNVANTPNALTNSGLLKASSQGTLRISDGFTNNGVIHAAASSLVDVDAALTNGVNGRIFGSGELEVSSQLTNNGTIAPGDVAGTLTVDLGNTGNLAFGSSSVLEINLASASNYGRLSINGRTTLGGRLDVRLLNGYGPGLADGFTVLTSTNTTTTPSLGAFSNVANGGTILSADGKAFFTVTHLSNNQVRLSNFDLVGDFDNDGDLDATDIDALLRATPGTVPPAQAQFDVNFNGSVVVSPGAAGSDSRHWVTHLKATAFGDANLDRSVNFSDLLVVAQNYGNASNALGWAVGNFDGVGGVNFDDLLLLAQNYGFGAGALVDDPDLGNTTFAADWALARSMVVPEPATLAALAGVAMALRRRR